MKIVIVGAGEVGFHIARHLTLENKEVVVIDKNADAIRRVSDNLDVQVIQGSGSSPVVLEEAGIRNAEVILAVTDSDEANLVACLVANMLSPSTQKMARVRDGDFDQYHDHFRQHAPHIDTIINPEIEVVKTIESMLRVPGAADVGELADGRIKFIGIYLDKNSRLAGVRLAEIPDKITHVRLLIAAVVREEELIISIKGEQAEVIEALALETSDIVDKPLKRVSFPKGAIVTGIIRNDDIIIPTGESVIRPEDRVIILARRQAIPKVEKILSVKLEYF